MTPDESAFRRAIQQSPDDDLPRMAWADWLGDLGGEVKCSRIGGKCDGKIWSTSRATWDECDDCLQCGGTGRTPDAVTARGEFVRVSCNVAALRDYIAAMNGLVGAASVNLEQLQSRESALLTTHAPAWFPGITPYLDRTQFDAHDPTRSGPTGYVRRGMLEGVRCTVGQLVGVCWGCNGRGTIRVPGGHGDADDILCDVCNSDENKRMVGIPSPNSGKLSPIAAAVGREPAGVVLVGRYPVLIGCDAVSEAYNWMPGRSDNPEPESPHFLGPTLFELADLPYAEVGGDRMNAKYALTRELALNAANTAATAYCRAAWEKSLTGVSDRTENTAADQG